MYFRHKMEGFVKRFCFAILSFLAVLILNGCRNPGEGPGTVTILALKGPSAMGMVVLMDSLKTVDGKGVNIEVLEEPMQVRARMLVDKPEIALLPLNMASILYNKGLKYQLLAVPIWGTLYLFGTDTLISAWQDLKGKTVYMMGKGATPDILFRYLLEKNGLVPGQDVILDYSFPTHLDLANAVIAGQADLAVLSEPEGSLAQERNGAVRLIMDLNREWAEAVPENPGLPQTALLVRSDFARDHASGILGIAESWKQSTEWVTLHPTQAARLIVDHRILPDSSTAARSIPRSNLQFKYAEDVRSCINGYLKVFFTFNPDAVGGHMPDEKFIYTKPDH